MTNHECNSKYSKYKVLLSALQSFRQATSPLNLQTFRHNSSGDVQPSFTLHNTQPKATQRWPRKWRDYQPTGITMTRVLYSTQTAIHRDAVWDAARHWTHTGTQHLHSDLLPFKIYVLQISWTVQTYPSFKRLFSVNRYIWTGNFS
jgi:hypothetical protein